MQNCSCRVLGTSTSRSQVPLPAGLRLQASVEFLATVPCQSSKADAPPIRRLACVGILLRGTTSCTVAPCWRPLRLHCCCSLRSAPWPPVLRWWCLETASRMPASRATSPWQPLAASFQEPLSSTKGSARGRLAPVIASGIGAAQPARVKDANSRMDQGLLMTRVTAKQCMVICSSA